MKYYPLMCTNKPMEILGFLGFNGNEVFEFFFRANVEVLQCYMYELMMAYSKKLVYLPSRKGNIKVPMGRLAHRNG